MSVKYKICRRDTTFDKSIKPCLSYHILAYTLLFDIVPNYMII